MIFDTETTGLPKVSQSALIAKDVWPDLVSLSYFIYEVSKTERKLVKRVDHVIKPDDWVIPEESIAFHKITNAVAHDTGLPLKTVLEEFSRDIKNISTIVAHNLYFDKNVIFNAMYWRCGINPYSRWSKNIVEFCTFKKYKSELDDISKRKDLNSLYRDTFNTDPPANAHNSLRDVEVLDSIFWKRWDLEKIEYTAVQ